LIADMGMPLISNRSTGNVKLKVTPALMWLEKT
jgi:hypothetical protein